MTGFCSHWCLGLVAGLGRISKNTVVRNLALTYVEFVRGVPILVLIAMTAFVIVPQLSSVFGFDNASIDFFWRASAALALISGAYLAEVFRAGIESVPQRTNRSGPRTGDERPANDAPHRAPASSAQHDPGDRQRPDRDARGLVLALGARSPRTHPDEQDLHIGNFQYEAGYLVLTFFYLSMTLVLSLLLRAYPNTWGSTMTRLPNPGRARGPRS